MNKLNIGCGQQVLEGWINLDKTDSTKIELVFDLNGIPQTKLPIEENTIKDIYAAHVIEHLDNPLQVFSELWRIAEPGCRIIIRVPHGSSDAAHNDPTHKRIIFPGFFTYLGQPKYHKFCYGYFADWKIEKILLTTPKVKNYKGKYTELFEDINTKRNYCEEIIAVLTAVKPARPRLLAAMSAHQVLISGPIHESYEAVMNTVLS